MEILILLIEVCYCGYDAPKKFNAAEVLHFDRLLLRNWFLKDMDRVVVRMRNALAPLCDKVPGHKVYEKFDFDKLHGQECLGKVWLPERHVRLSLALALSLQHRV